MSDVLTIPYCTKAWADKYFSESAFADNWLNSSPEKQMSALQSATNFIDLYVSFFDKKGEPFFFTSSAEDDWSDEKTPRRLKQSCAQEAIYLLSLDDNPAEPHPLTVLGLVSTDGKRFDKEFTPPIFPSMVVKLLQSLGGEVDPETTGADSMQIASKLTSF